MRRSWHTRPTARRSRPSTAIPCASGSRAATSGRAPSGCAGSSSRTSTGPGSGRATAITTTPTRGRRSATASEVVERFCARLEQLVNQDSPSDGIEQEWIAGRGGERSGGAGWATGGGAAGCASRWVTEPDGPARSMVVSLPGDGGPMVALLGHTDTVFPVGTAVLRPFLRAGDRCFGPGVADMKGGVLLATAAIERLASAPSRPFSAVRLLVCADE